MKQYMFVKQGGEIKATLDGSGVLFEKMIRTFEAAGYEVKEVSKSVYDQEKEMMAAE